MFPFHIAIELTVRYQVNTVGEGGSAGRRSIIQRKDKEERKTEREKGRKMSPLAVVLSQYVVTIAV